jgi:hypothetical protein
LEEFPELLRVPREHLKGTIDLTAHRGLAGSPRFQEEHPALLRAAPAVTAGAVESERLVELSRNSALSASPRFLEEHPELSRSAVTVEVAPVK